jgi:probable rRNA maturation factor
VSPVDADAGLAIACERQCAGIRSTPPHGSSMIHIAIANQQKLLPIDRRAIRRVIVQILRDHEIREAEFSVAIVDASTSHEVNREFLGHDYPADVISFPLDHAKGQLEGELVLCADVAVDQAKRYGWKAEEELLLYVVHGTLHLVGYDDLSTGPRRTMRAKERHYLAELGIEVANVPRKPRSSRRQ